MSKENECPRDEMVGTSEPMQEHHGKGMISGPDTGGEVIATSEPMMSVIVDCSKPPKEGTDQD